MDGEENIKMNNHNDNNIENKTVTKVAKAKYRNSVELEMFHENGELEILRRPSILQKQTTVTSEDMQEYSDLFENMPLTDETTCGFWFFRGKWLQKCANKKAYVALYGLLGCVYGASYAYFNGTITTLEKRFKIPSRTTGVISVGNDISQVFVSMVLSYYGGKYHRPRCLAFGMFTIVIFCLMTALPHFLYGPGEDSIQLTVEYGGVNDENLTSMVFEKQKRKTLCQEGEGSCNEEVGNFSPQALLFTAQLISGIGGSLYYSLGTSYMDDNIQKAKTPALISFSYFLRMLGPALGYGLASVCLKMYIDPSLTPTITTQDPRWLGAWWLGFSYFFRMLGPAAGYALASLCLKIYIAPNLTPIITNTDPRWIGAWWIGWLILGGLVFFFSFLIGLFPKTLPRAAVRRMIAEEKNKGKELPEEKPASFMDMLKTYKRLLKNRTLVCNNLSSIFYCFGYMPYWLFMPKYIETIYKQSASKSSFITGTVGLVFSAVGVLLSGIVITKFKPSARYLAGWNVVVGTISVLGMFAYVHLGCEAEDVNLRIYSQGSYNTECNRQCHCDFIPYTPVCSERNETFISPCHAGCQDSEEIPGTKTKKFTNCACIQSTNTTQSPPITTDSSYFTSSGLEITTYIDQITEAFQTEDQTEVDDSIVKRSVLYDGVASQGACPIDCTSVFYTFLCVVCLLKFVGATGRATNFLVSVRCVDEKDKPASMGFNIAILSFFAFVPSPILFGYILDTTCLVWGQTCSGKGNCWLYDGQSLRHVMNFTSIGFVTIGTLFDAGVWYYVKDLKIFDDEVEVKVVNTGSGED